MVTCRDILNLQMDGVELIAGEEGLNRIVSWTYLVQTRPYSDHMNQGNFALIVVDYVRFDFQEVYRTMEELYELGISCMGISVVEEKEPVPEKLIQRANELRLPLFYIRWHGASFVDIDQSVGKLLLEDNVQNKRSGDFLYNLLFGYDIHNRYIDKISAQFGLDFTRYYRVGIIVVDRTYGMNLEQDEHIYEYYSHCLDREIAKMQDRPMVMRFLNKVVLLFEARKDHKTEQELEKILLLLDNQVQFRGIIKSTCILGSKYKEPQNFSKSYQEAKNLIPKKDFFPQSKTKKVLSAAAMGIYKFLFNNENQEEILKYCSKKLEKLEEYDHANGTCLIDTALSYYMNGFVVSRTAEALFIHRNSLQYRLNKIEELLEIGLDDYTEYLDLVNCILVKKMMFL